MRISCSSALLVLAAGLAETTMAEACAGSAASIYAVPAYAAALQGAPSASTEQPPIFRHQACRIVRACTDCRTVRRCD